MLETAHDKTTNTQRCAIARDSTLGKSSSMQEVGMQCAAQWHTNPHLAVAVAHARLLLLLH